MSSPAWPRVWACWKPAWPTFFHDIIIDKPGAVRASSVACIPPIVAMIIGVVLVGEAINTWEYAGAALILCGVALIHQKPQDAETADRTG